MRPIRVMTGAALGVIATLALAQSPYVINGLHTELVFTEAVAAAKKLGGKCQVTKSEAPEVAASALCEYAPGLTVAAQPILRINLEAPEETERLTRVMIQFEGSRDAIADSLQGQFGPPNSDGTRADAKSWSHSHRLHWTQGPYRMSLLDSPKLLILTTERTQE